MPVLLIAAALAAAPAATALPSGMHLAQLSLRSRVTVRIRSFLGLPPSGAGLREHKGPRCLPMSAIQGAAVRGNDSVDFILRGGRRIRARLDSDCPALDFYSGFYLDPGADGQLCADRDSVRSRAGGECSIDRFRLLVPKAAP